MPDTDLRQSEAPVQIKTPEAKQKRGASIWGYCTDPEKAEIDDRVSETGFDSSSEGIRFVMLTFARSRAVQEAVAAAELV